MTSLRDRLPGELPDDPRESYIPPLTMGAGSLPPVHASGVRWTVDIGEKPDADGAGAPNAAEATADTFAVAQPSRGTARGESGGPGDGGPLYHLRRVIGRGGMGEVWEAVQVSLGRLVAVKRVRERMWDDESVASKELGFRQEACITARLDHPNIVPVYDLGVDQNGSPLLAMKLARGTGWHTQLDEDFEALPAADFLARHIPVLVAVGQAVAFAHARGIVHRDIKPAQVVVGDYGEVLLMDWGLAIHCPPSATASAEMAAPATPRAGDGTAPADDVVAPVELPGRETATNPAGTPALMAPEQTDATAHRIGPWTDVFLLGGTLYHLLTRTYPYMARDPLLAMEEAGEARVQSPHDRAAGREIPAELAGLAMRSMAREPHERVSSARAFVTALQDWLGGTSQRREARELADRARATLASAGGSYDAITEGLTLIAKSGELWARNPDLPAIRNGAFADYARAALAHGDLRLARLQGERTDPGEPRDALLRDIGREEARTLRRERQRRRAVAASLAFLFLLVFGGAVFSWNLNAARRDALAQRDKANAARNETEGLVKFMLSDLQEQLAPNDPKLAALDSVSERALEYYFSLAVEDLGEPEIAELADGLQVLGSVLLGQGRPEEAARCFTRLIELGSSRLDDPYDPSWARVSAGAHNHLGLAAEARADHDMARRHFAAATTVRERLVARTSLPNDRLHLGISLYRHGSVALEEGQTTDALQFFEKGVALVAEARRAEPDNAQWKREEATGYTWLGGTMRTRGDIVASRDAYVTALRLMEEALAANPEDISLRADTANTRKLLAGTLLQTGDAEGAYRLQGKLVEDLRAVFVARPAVLENHYHLAQALMKHVEYSRQVGRRAETLGSSEEAYRLSEELAARDPQNLDWQTMWAEASVVLGDALASQGRTDEALASIRRGRDIHADIAARHPELPSPAQRSGGASNSAAILLRRIGRLPEAIEEFGRARATLEEALVRTPGAVTMIRELCTALSWLGGLREGDGDLTGALELAEETARRMEDVVRLAPGFPYFRRDLAMTYARIARLSDLLGRTEDATAALDTSFELSRALATEYPDDLQLAIQLAQAWRVRATIAQDRADEAEAAEHLAAAKLIYDDVVRRAPGSAAWAGEALANDGWLIEMRAHVSGDYATAIAQLEAEWPRWDAIGNAVNTDPDVRLNKAQYELRILRSMLRAGRADDAMARVAPLIAWMEAEKAAGTPMRVVGRDYLAPHYLVEATGWAQKGDAGRAAERLEAAAAAGPLNLPALREAPLYQPLRDAVPDLVASVIAAAEAKAGL